MNPFDDPPNAWLETLFFIIGLTAPWLIIFLSLDWIAGLWLLVAW